MKTRFTKTRMYNMLDLGLQGVLFVFLIITIRIAPWSIWQIRLALFVTSLVLYRLFGFLLAYPNAASCRN